MIIFIIMNNECIYMKKGEGKIYVTKKLESYDK